MRKGLTIISLIANLVGTLLLFYGLQVTSLGDVQIWRTPDDATAICDGTTLLYESGGRNGNVMVGSRPNACQAGHPIAVISGEHPAWIHAGLALILLATVFAMAAEIGERAKRRRRSIRMKPNLS